MGTLSTREARAFYDRFGARQDDQAFYESRALAQLVDQGAFEQAGSVFEFGCGTGRFARELLEQRLPDTATYLGTDISATMVGLAGERLAPFGARARVIQGGGEVDIALPDRSVDRVVSTYVLDLLPVDSARAFIDEAGRVLRADGRLCLVGITPGVTPISRLVMGAWRRLFARKPVWVGGCRPTRVAEMLPPQAWQLRFHTVVVAWGIASEVLVATPVGPIAAQASAP